MSKNNKTKHSGLALLLIFVLIAAWTLQVSAGNITVLLPSVNDEGELNVSDWYDPNDELKVVGGALVIPDDSTSETRIISKVFASKDDAYSNMAELSGKFRFTSLPNNKYFSIGFGLDDIEAYSEEPGNVEIVFRNNGGLTAEAVFYDENGDMTQLASAVKCGSMSSVLNISAVLTCSDELYLSVNGNSILKVKLPDSCEGRLGLLQSGGCGVSILDFNATFHKYDRPENSNYTETFENGIYNDNLFTTAHIDSARSPAGLVVEEYGGSKVLMFRNTGRAYFGTKQQYSNFELTFDIPFFCRETVLDEEGNVVIKPCNTFCISIGDVAQEFSGWDFVTSTELVHFTASNVWGYNHKPEKFRVPYSEMGLFDPDTNEGFSVKIRMVDGNFSFGLKKLPDKDFNEVATATYENFRTGYIKIWSTGDSNAAIDNVSLTNLDENPAIVDAEFRSALIKVADYDYTKIQPVWKSKSQSSEASKGFNWWIITAAAGGAAVLILTAAIVVRIVRDKRGKTT